MCACSVIPFFGKLLKFGIFSEIGIRNYNFPKTVLYFKVEERKQQQDCAALQAEKYFSNAISNSDMGFYQQLFITVLHWQILIVDLITK